MTDEPDAASTSFAESPLSQQEVRVVELAAAGHTNEQIGRRLHLSPNTVAAYLSAAMARLLARNRAELVARCFVHGVLDTTTWPPRRTRRARRPGALARSR